ncbi:MAG: HAD family hydrolase [Holosporales bacterium]
MTILAVDIDGTIHPSPDYSDLTITRNNIALSILDRWLVTLRDADIISAFGYSTSNSLKDALRKIQTGTLPSPDFIGSASGTELHFKTPNDEWIPHALNEKYLEDINFPIQKIIMSTADFSFHQPISENWLKLTPCESQEEIYANHARAFNIIPTQGAFTNEQLDSLKTKIIPALITHINTTLQKSIRSPLEHRIQVAVNYFDISEKGIEIVIIPQERERKTDVLQFALRNNNNGEFAEHPWKKNGIIFAGNTYNDLNILTDPEISFILVGNADESFKQTVETEQQKHTKRAPVYISRTPLALGIIEGVLACLDTEKQTIALLSLLHIRSSDEQYKDLITSGIIPDRYRGLATENGLISLENHLKNPGFWLSQKNQTR